MSDTSPSDYTPKDFLPGAAKYVKSHLAVINNVALASATLVGLIDFFCPLLHGLPMAIYSITMFLLVVACIAGAKPEIFRRMFSALGFPVKPGGAAVWRHPVYQITVAFLFAVTAIGWVSVAKAKEGGVIAAAFPDARKLQSSLLHIETDVAEIKVGVVAANGKLDSLVANSKDPQKDLVARGYPYEATGLHKAIVQGDKNAVALFVKAGLRFDNHRILSAFLDRKIPFDPEIAAMLQRSMFTGTRSCLAEQFTEGWTLDHIPERVAFYKRVCDSDAMVHQLRLNIDADQKAGSPPNEAYATMRKYRQIYLEEFLRS